ncbi:MAG: laccase domain-containing protein [Acidimicrobiia bacterium]|nr:laccase domain-containing protein [Acidimicrobiia bacterium]
MIHRRIGTADAWFSDRRFGTSRAPFDSANLGRHVGDDPDAVAANHAEFARLAGVDPTTVVLPHHVHGTTVVQATGTDSDDPDADGVDADGVVTAVSGLALMAIGADCAPIALANDGACAAVHAGWRGAVDGIIPAAVAAVRACGAGPVRAVVGPCVCAAHYEFGEELLADLADRVGPHVAQCTAEGKPAFDLRATIVHALRAAAVDDVEVLDVCTVESPDYFSYRRDGRTGRHGVLVVKR